MSRPTASLPDFYVSGGGTVYLVRPLTPEARQHLVEHTADDAQWLGDALAVEHRYVDSLAQQLRNAGFTLGRGW